MGGENNAPPEDCGGLPGFYNILETLGEPEHPDHGRVKEWFEDYDPKRIDTASIQKALTLLARRCGASKKRAGKKREAA